MLVLSDTSQSSSWNFWPVENIKLPTGRISYRKAGSGPSILLIHGWGGSSRHWYQTMHHLTPAYTVYALDMPGYGNSPPLFEPTSAKRLAEIVIEFADALNIELFDLNGHSFGGAVAAYTAAQWPTRVHRLIISSFGIPATEMERLVTDQTYHQTLLTVMLWDPWIMISQPWIAFWQSWAVGMGYIPEIPSTVARPFFFHLPNDQEMIREGYNDFVCMNQRTSMQSAISLGNPSLRGAMSRITAPTLIVGGKQDLVVPSAALATAQQTISNSQLVLMENCGHVPMIEQPAAYNQVVQKFLDTTQQSDILTV